MHKKIRLLITVSILGLLALSLIQGYLINNTYKLKKAAFISETRKSISRIDDLSPNLDSINDIWQSGFLNVLVDYQSRIIKKKQILPKFDSIISSINNSDKNILSITEIDNLILEALNKICIINKACVILTCCVIFSRVLFYSSLVHFDKQHP